MRGHFAAAAYLITGYNREMSIRLVSSAHVSVSKNQARAFHGVCARQL